MAVEPEPQSTNIGAATKSGTSAGGTSVGGTGVGGTSVESALIRMKSSMTDAPKRARMPTIEHDELRSAEDLRNPMFAKLVEREDDTVGLLAYALYKQSKRDWLIAFTESHGRSPSDAEARSFITGEQLTRRLLTYRQLAQQQLDILPATQSETPRKVIDAGTNAGTNAASASAAGTNMPPMAPKSGFWPINKGTLRYLAIMTGLVVAMAIVFRMVAAWLFR